MFIYILLQIGERSSRSIYNLRHYPLLLIQNEPCIIQKNISKAVSFMVSYNNFTICKKEIFHDGIPFSEWEQNTFWERTSMVWNSFTAGITSSMIMTNHILFLFFRFFSFFNSIRRFECRIDFILRHKLQLMIGT